jgi:outer membrane protein
MRKQLLTASLAMFAVLAAPSVLAHKAGDIIVRAGAAHVAPDEDSSELKAGGAPVTGTKATLNDNTQLGLTATYMITDKIGVELLAATPFSHRIGVKGVDAALGLPAGSIDGKFADTKHLPPTVSLQFYPLGGNSGVQPYVGAGLNYTWFFDEGVTSRQKANGFSRFRLKNSVGLALQAGIDVPLNDRLVLNAAVWYIDIDTKATVQHNALGKIKVDVDVDPWVYFVGLGYKF